MPSEICEIDAASPRRTHTFRHGNRLIALTLPRCADELIDERAFADDERLPYWADLWPSARALARFLLDHPPSVNAASDPAARAIELGCGATALPSIVLAGFGINVLATDYEPEALDAANINIAANRASCDDKQAMVATELLDWRNPTPDLGVFDLVVAADLMYEQRNAVVLADFVPHILARGGRMILADPGRRYLSEFQSRMQQRGFIPRSLAVVDEAQEDPDKPASRVRIIEFRGSSTE